MAVLDIRVYPDSILRTKCTRLPDITEDLLITFADMAETMYAANGIGLAAPQVGLTHRMIVVDVGTRENGTNSGLLKMLNPLILSGSGTIEMEEGCLSIPNIRETVKRMERIQVRYTNDNGIDISLDADGLLAVCIQHEIDHLDGILFTDRLSPLRKQLIKSKLDKLRRKSSTQK